MNERYVVCLVMDSVHCILLIGEISITQQNYIKCSTLPIRPKTCDIFHCDGLLSVQILGYTKVWTYLGVERVD